MQTVTAGSLRSALISIVLPTALPSVTSQTLPACIVSPWFGKVPTAMVLTDRRDASDIVVRHSSMRSSWSAVGWTRPVVDALSLSGSIPTSAGASNCTHS